MAKVKITLRYWLENIKNYNTEEIKDVAQQIKRGTKTGRSHERSFDTWKKSQLKKRAETEVSPKFKQDFNFIGSSYGLEAATDWAKKNKPKQFKTYTEGKVFIGGGYKDEKDFDEWADGINNRWTDAQISNLQVNTLGFKKGTGKYDRKTRNAHWNFLKNRTETPNIPITSSKGGGEGGYLSFNRGKYYPKGTDLTKKYSEQEKRSLETQAFYNQQAEQQEEEELKQKQDVETYLTKVWTEATGTTPDKLDMQWAKKQYAGGWGYGEYAEWARNLPVMKKNYPGLPQDMGFTEYNELASAANSVWLQHGGGTPLTNEQLENFFTNRKLPDLGFNTGKSVIEGV